MITIKKPVTRVDEVAAGISRICTPLAVIPGGFRVNSYLIGDDEYGALNDFLAAALEVTRSALKSGR